MCDCRDLITSELNDFYIKNDALHVCNSCEYHYEYSFLNKNDYQNEISYCERTLPIYQMNTCDFCKNKIPQIFGYVQEYGSFYCDRHSLDEDQNVLDSHVFSIMTNRLPREIYSLIM